MYISAFVENFDWDSLHSRVELRVKGFYVLAWEPNPHFKNLRTFTLFERQGDREKQ